MLCNYIDSCILLNNHSLGSMTACIMSETKTQTNFCLLCVSLTFPASQQLTFILVRWHCALSVCTVLVFCCRGGGRTTALRSCHHTHTKDFSGTHRYSIAACWWGTRTGRPRPACTIILLQRAGAAHTQEDLVQHRYSVADAGAEHISR